VLERLSMTAEPGSTTIMVTRLFDAPPSAVFEAWTKAEHVAHWWDPSGAPLAVCEIDLRPGGAFRWVNQGDKGMEYPFTGTYREIAPPDGLVFAARTFPSSPESIATLSFIEYSGGTKFIMTIECQSIEDRDALLAMRVDVGTARTLENLAAFLHQIGQTEESK
jgi:uncharacterized protein YndB with AHSA1/START domain